MDSSEDQKHNYILRKCPVQNSSKLEQPSKGLEKHRGDPAGLAVVIREFQWKGWKVTDWLCNLGKVTVLVLARRHEDCLHSRCEAGGLCYVLTISDIEGLLKNQSTERSSGKEAGRGH